MEIDERYVDWSGHRTWIGIAGEASDRPPLLALHGGPGAGSDYLWPLADLGDRQVIFYDQLGCGRSDHIDDPSLWVLDTFVSELTAVRSALGLERVHLLGQSWGGMLALEHVLAGAPGITSLTLASTLASTDDWVAAVSAQRAALPANVRAVLDANEAAGTTDSEEYGDAVLAFYRAHVCRIWPFPASVQRSFENIEADPTIYTTMWGPNEFVMTGNLAGWDVRGRLTEINLPTLITSGAYDESAAGVNEPMARGIKGATWIVFDESAHMAHIEEQSRYLEVLRGFLHLADA
jgi:proline-specific peptidase